MFEKIQVSLKPDNNNNNGTVLYMKTDMCTFLISHSVFLRMRKVSDKSCRSFFLSLLAIRKHCTVASYKVMCWRVGRGSRLASSDATSIVLVEGPSSF